MLPPPPRESPVTILFVGHTPKKLKNNFFGRSRDEAFNRAQNLRYVGVGRRQMVYNTYYSPLVSLAKIVSPSFGVWWEVEQDRVAKHKIEFTDLCHLPFTNDKEYEKVLTPAAQVALNAARVPNFQEFCREHLKREILHMKPKVVVCNGVKTANAVRHISGILSQFDPATDSPHFFSNVLKTHVHLSGFMTPPRPLDVFNQARIASEIRQALGRF